MVDKAGEKNFATRCCRIVFEHAMMECQECLRVTIQQAGTALLAQMAGAPRKSLQPQYSLSGNSWSRVEWSGVRALCSRHPPALAALSDSTAQPRGTLYQWPASIQSVNKAYELLGKAMFWEFKVQLVGVESGRQKTDSKNPKSSVFADIKHVSPFCN